MHVENFVRWICVVGCLLGLQLLAVSPVVGATPESIPCCQALDAAELERARAIMERQFLYDCCDDTVAICLGEEAESCPLAARLAGEICRRVGAGETDTAIEQALRLRARSMMADGPRATIELEGVPVMGHAQAPVEFVEYACVRCPFCAELTPLLMAEVEQGALAGKVRFYFKLFPIKGHEGSTESGLAAVAAHAQGRFWDFLELSYERFGGFSSGELESWAAQLGLDREAYAAAVADPASRKALADSKREGMGNGVKATPTFFINGRLYHGQLELGQLLDVLGEEYERVASGGS